jgi:RNA polymerase sigma factor (sigma-70 family)
LEVSQKQYKKSRSEKNHRDYLKKFEDNISVLSLDSPCGEDYDGSYLYHEVIGDSSVNTEKEAIDSIKKQKLREAISSLPKDDNYLITELFFCNKTEQKIAESMGITRQAVNKKKRGILEKLNNSC